MASSSTSSSSTANTGTSGSSWLSVILPDAPLGWNLVLIAAVVLVIAVFAVIALLWGFIGVVRDNGTAADIFTLFEGTDRIEIGTMIIAVVLLLVSIASIKFAWRFALLSLLMAWFIGILSFANAPANMKEDTASASS